MKSKVAKAVAASWIVTAAGMSVVAPGPVSVNVVPRSNFAPLIWMVAVPALPTVTGLTAVRENGMIDAVSE